MRNVVSQKHLEIATNPSTIGYFSVKLEPTPLFRLFWPLKPGESRQEDEKHFDLVSQRTRNDMFDNNGWKNLKTFMMRCSFDLIPSED